MPVPVKSWFYNSVLCVICALYTLAPFPSFAQHPHPAFRHYEVDEGLASSVVYHVIQDSKGYIWFATSMGLTRFDGYGFHNFTVKDGLPASTVFNLFEDHQDRIWFTTFSGKIGYYHDGRIHQFKYNDELQKWFSTLYKTSFHVDRDENVWISVIGKGYFKISKTGEILQYASKKTKGYKILQLDSSTIFLSYFSSDSEKPGTQISIESNQLNAEIGMENIVGDNNARCVKRHDNTILLTWKNELAEIRSSNNYSKHTLSHRAISLTEDRDQNIWLGTFGGGVFFYEGADLSKPYRIYLDGMSVSSVLHDMEGGVWFTTLDHGVYYMPSHDFKTFNKTNGFTEDKVSSVTSDGNNTIYAGLQSGKVYIIDDTVSRMIDLGFDPKAPQHLNALYFDHKSDVLWAVSTRNHYKINTNGMVKLARGGNALTITKDNSLWLGVPGGIVKENNEEIEEIRGPSNNIDRIYAMYEDSEERLWLGGQGLTAFADKNFLFYGDRDELLKTTVTSIVEAREGTLCIATQGAGVLFLENGTVIHQLNTDNGLSTDVVNDLFVDNNTIWVSTSNGLNMITFTDYPGFKYEIETYTTIDGLASNEINQVVILGENIWVATNKGLTFFNTKSIEPDTIAPPLYITGINIAGKEMAMKNDYYLEYDRNNFRISFMGLSFGDPGKLQYRYSMTGVDSGWIYTGNTSVQYTTLPNGDYTFLVSARNKDGYWRDPPVKIHFSIAPPFWKTLWFRGLIVTAVATLVYLFFRIRVLTYNRDVVRELLQALVQRVKRERYLLVKVVTDGSKAKIPLHRVLWIEAAKDYVEIVTEGKKYLVRMRMKDIEKELEGEKGLVRVHRSYIVNQTKVVGVKRNVLYVNDKQIPGGVSFKSEIANIKQHLENRAV